MTDAIGLRLEARNASFMQKSPVKFLDNNLIFGGGLELALGGRSRDTDEDGVPDKRDRCPNTPRYRAFTRGSGLKRLFHGSPELSPPSTRKLRP